MGTDTASAGRAAAGGVRVAVVGGGAAGLTSALKLAQRGYQVTLYEATDILGGNTSSDFDPATGLYQDVYPHMFCNWYANFWNIFETDLGQSREAAFEPHMGVRVLKPEPPGAPTPQNPDYIQLWNATTPGTVWANLTSGVAPFPDMFLLGYSMIDIAGHPKTTTYATRPHATGSPPTTPDAEERQPVATTPDFVNMLDVNGFIYSRGYSTQEVALLQNYILKVIWSIPSTSTAAISYQDFIKHSLVFPKPQPFAWYLKGSLQRRLVQPWAEKLHALGCEIRTSCPVAKVALIDTRPRLHLEDGAVEDFDFVVLAVPAGVLANLALTGEPGERIVDQVPRLSEVACAQAEAIPVVNLHLKKKLNNFPRETVGLRGSVYDISAIDISQLWSGEDATEDRTVLVVAASSGNAIPSADPHERGWMVISRLSEYVPDINPGAYWGDESGDVCWELTRYRSNDDRRLFVNDVGSLDWRPRTAYETLPRVAFAGDCCRTDVNMATVEAAVQSGLMAAQAIWLRAPLGKPIEPAGHEVYSAATLLAAKLVLMPLAYGATAWSDMIAQRQIDRDGSSPLVTAAPGTYTLMLPLAYAMDWCKTAYWLLRSLPKPNDSASGAASVDGVAPTDQAIDPAAELLMVASRALKVVAARLPGKDDPQVAAGVSAISALAGKAWESIKTAYGQQQAPVEPPDPSAPYQRRWRPKP
jgi:phytoene dehydrogenase-like protein